MKLKELRQKSKLGLKKIMGEDKEKLRELRFNLLSGKIKNVKEIKKVKKEIARIMTILSE